MSETILVTGGAGYVGSHALVSLAARGHRVIALDDLSRGNEDAVRRAEKLAGVPIALEVGDICDAKFVAAALRRCKPDAVVHLAGFKSVAESVSDPDRYEHVNVGGTAILADALVEAGIRRVVYASTASVYGDADTPDAIDESAEIQPISPYASTKYRGEVALNARPELDAVVHLRFFNVCGAHPSGKLGEYVDRPQNLMPVLLRGAWDDTPITVFGTDYPTRDGTCVRDYIHVLDIVSGIELALAETARRPINQAYNLGTGSGSTVLEVTEATRRATQCPLETHLGDRRPGDPATCVADAGLARSELGWKPSYGLGEMAEHAWSWMKELS